MTLLTQIVIQEKRRIERMIKQYERALIDLPKGTLVRKSIKSNSYYYLQYRQGDKTVSKYVGKDMKKIEKVRLQVEKRRHIEAMLKALYAEHAQACKITKE